MQYAIKKHHKTLIGKKVRLQILLHSSQILNINNPPTVAEFKLMDNNNPVKIPLLPSFNGIE